MPVLKVERSTPRQAMEAFKAYAPKVSDFFAVGLTMDQWLAYCQLGPVTAAKFCEKVVEKKQFRSFKLLGTKLLAIDPGTAIPTDDVKQLNRCLPGTWFTDFQEQDLRVRYLRAWHEDHEPADFNRPYQTRVVETERIALFDEQFFPKDMAGTDNTETDFKASIKKATFRTPTNPCGVGVFEFGVVCTTGYGNSEYPLYISREPMVAGRRKIADRSIVGVSIKFF